MAWAILIILGAVGSEMAEKNNGRQIQGKGQIMLQVK
jgi:hypothetical protein